MGEIGPRVGQCALQVIAIGGIVFRFAVLVDRLDSRKV